jgi:aminoglycoside phosphotransferase (APT) family kinase protein
MTGVPDGTIPPREGEGVDPAALAAWLRAVRPGLLADGAVLAIRQYPAGFSNLTYAVSGGAPGKPPAFVLRRPPRGVAGGIAHDMGREHDLLAALHPLGVPVPAPMARCDDPSVIGAPFYLMAHVAGTIVRRPADLGADDGARPARLAALSQAFVRALAQLHAVDVSAPPLAALGRPEGYVQRQVAGWTKRWLAARTGDVPAIDQVAAWLEAHRPPERGAALVHNDFKFDNLVVELEAPPRAAVRVRAILDWEMATVGDPLMDLGTALAYWVEAGDAPVFRTLGLGVTALPGAFTRAELVQAYAAASGRDVSDAPWYQAFGLFKVAVIAQQIYARHVRGLTADPRFAQLDQVVAALGTRALHVAAAGRL